MRAHPAAVLGDTAAHALARAAEWRLLALLLERPHGEWSHAVSRLGNEVADADLRDAAELAGDAAEGSYLALLGPGGAVSSRLVGYRRFADPGWVLSDLTRFYDAFAFHPATEDPRDHVAVALQFVSYLYVKEAFARSIDDRDATAVTVLARERFVEEHLQPVVHPFAEKVAGLGPAYIAAAARSLAARVPPPLPEPATLAGLDGDDLDTGMCESCAVRTSGE